MSKNDEIKPMIYTNKPAIDVLANGTFKGYEFVILSYGTHPCAYIGIPKGHRFYNRMEYEIPIDCHGNLTYADFGIHGHMKDKYVIGWDYNHVCDQFRRWTTEEILEEVHEVIDQIVKGDESEQGTNA